MRRLALGSLASFTAAFLLLSCGTVKTPTEPTPAMPSGFGSISLAATASPSTNFAACLGGSPTSACFSVMRVSVRGLAVASATAPGSPSNLAASTSGSTVTLTWVAPSSGDPTTAYVIEAGSAPGVANLANFSTGNALTLFQASGVGAGIYYVRVKAVNAAGVSAASNEAILTVGSGPCSAPGAPSGLTLTVNTGGVVSFAWITAPGSPTSYVIEAGSLSGLTNLANSDLGSTATTMTATGVGAGTYYVRVRAKNACGISGTSNEVSLTVGSTGPGPCGALGAPSQLVGSISGRIMELNWTAAAGTPTSYVVEGGQIPWAVIDGGQQILNSLRLFVTDTGNVATSIRGPLTQNNYAFIRVRAKNACGTSAPSNEIILSVDFNPGLLAPPGPYDGNWFGRSSEGLTVAFQVLGNQISLFYYDTICGPTHMGLGAAVYPSNRRVPWIIANNAFSIPNPPSGIDPLVDYHALAGTFSSSSSASGTTTDVCYAVAKNLTWTAEKH